MLSTIVIGAVIQAAIGAIIPVLTNGAINVGPSSVISAILSLIVILGMVLFGGATLLLFVVIPLGVVCQLLLIEVLCKI